MILSRETYENIVAMLNSSDPENIIVGLSIIENTDFKNEFVQLLFLHKESDLTEQKWNEFAPKKVRLIKKHLNTFYARVPFKAILEAIHRNETRTECEYQFFMDKYADHMKEQFNNFNIIEKIEIKIKINESRSIS